MPVKPIMPVKKTSSMNNNIYYLENEHHGRTYFAIRGGLVQCDGTPTKVSVAKLLDFLAIAKEMGMKGGKL